MKSLYRHEGMAVRIEIYGSGLTEYVSLGVCTVHLIQVFKSLIQVRVL